MTATELPPGTHGRVAGAWVVFGIGHPDRGDRAAGWLVADLLEHVPGVRAARVPADPAALLTHPSWCAQQVVLVDSVVTGASSGSVHRWDGHELLGGPAAEGCPDDVGVAATLRLAAALRRLPARVHVVGIEGASFDPGTPPGHDVLVAVERVAAELADAARPRPAEGPVDVHG